jgi:hypothetical protein
LLKVCNLKTGCIILLKELKMERENLIRLEL